MNKREARQFIGVMGSLVEFVIENTKNGSGHNREDFSILKNAIPVLDSCLRGGYNGSVR